MLLRRALSFSPCPHRELPATGGHAPATDGHAPAIGGQNIWATLSLPTTTIWKMPLRVGSICSGMGTERWALKRLPWQFRFVFLCEKARTPRRFLIDNHEGGVPIFTDVLSDKFLLLAPPCDILMAGFPCQPFSRQGLGEGLHDRQGRGVIIFAILRYVRKHKPRIVLLENVLGLLFRHRSVLDFIVAELERQGYMVSYRVRDSKTHGAVPGSRPRVYVVAINQNPGPEDPLPRPATGGPSPATGGPSPATGGPSRMVWPQAVDCPSLDSIFDADPKLSSYANYSRALLSPKAMTMRRNLSKALAKVAIYARTRGLDPTKVPAVADLGGSKVQVSVGTAPCLTRTRGQSFRLWSLQHARPVSLRELCRLQGLNLDEMVVKVGAKSMAAMLGNGFTCTVLARIVGGAIQAAEGIETANEVQGTVEKHQYDTGVRPITASRQPATGRRQVLRRPSAAPTSVCRSPRLVLRPRGAS